MLQVFNKVGTLTTDFGNGNIDIERGCLPQVQLQPMSEDANHLFFRRQMLLAAQNASELCHMKDRYH